MPITSKVGVNSAHWVLMVSFLLAFATENIQYSCPHHLPHPFSVVTRLKLMLALLRSPDCCGFPLEAMKLEGSIKYFFPLHDPVEREVTYKLYVADFWFMLISMQLLRRQWLSLTQPPWHQPVDLVRNYFGEKV
jgi:hypothetical protein